MPAPDCPPNCPYAQDMGAHREAIETLKKEVCGIRYTLDEIKSLLSETKGGVRMLIGVGAVGGAVGAGFMKFLAFIKGVP